MALLYAAIVYLMGVALARWWEPAGGACSPTGAWWLLPLVLLPLTSLLNRWRQRRPYPPLRWPVAAGFEPPGQPPAPALFAGLLLCFSAGFLRYGSQPFTPCWEPGDLAYYNLPADRVFDPQAQQVTVTGMVAAYPLLVNGRQELEVAARNITVRDAAHAVNGRVRVTTNSPVRINYGEQISVVGRLAEPGVFDGFSYQDYLAIRGVHSVMVGAQVQAHDGRAGGSPVLRLLYAWRAQGEALIDRSLPEPYAALANGMLLGLKANIPDDLYAAFNTTGTSHVIVISGTNVALISGVIVAVAARLLGRRRAAWPALVGIALYALLVGGDTSVLRAALMGGLFVTATALHRRSTALVSLGAACMALTLANPLALWDIGLQLSGMATAGLILLVPRLLRGLHHFLGGAYAFLQIVSEDVLAVTLAANIMTLPLVLYYFARLSLSALPANLLIAFAQPLILFSGSAALVCGLAGGVPIAQALLWLAWLGLVWTVGIVQWAAGLPFAALTVPGFGLLPLVAAYAGIGLACGHRALWSGAAAVAAAWPGTPPLHNFPTHWLTAPLTLAITAALAVLLWTAALAQPDGRLHVWFLDVGQGDGILIQTPSGRQVLIDGGASSQTLLSELGAVMPFWDRTLDLLVLTHPDADHMAAQVQAMSRFAVGAAWETPASAAGANSAAWRTTMEAAGAQVQLQHAGGWADLGDGVALWVLSPPPQAFGGENEDNENSLVAKLVYGSVSVLLTGDASTLAETQLLAHGAPLQSTVLKVAHHGSKSSTGAAFVAAVQPALAVIQVGENRYGHPNAETMERLTGHAVLRTDKAGRIEVSSDGRQVWIETEKE